MPRFPFDTILSHWSKLFENFPPTPGAENGCTTKVSSTTWGWIKANYR